MSRAQHHTDLLEAAPSLLLLFSHRILGKRVSKHFLFPLV